MTERERKRERERERERESISNVVCVCVPPLEFQLNATPCSSLLVAFLLIANVFQDPLPSRWQWRVTIGALTITATGKVIAQTLLDSVCPIWSTDAEEELAGYSKRVCGSILPWFLDFAGNGGSCVSDFGTLLVVGAHRGALQYRGLWREASPGELNPELPAAKPSSHSLPGTPVAAVAAAPSPVDSSGRGAEAGRDECHHPNPWGHLRARDAEHSLIQRYELRRVNHSPYQDPPTCVPQRHEATHMLHNMHWSNPQPGA